MNVSFRVSQKSDGYSFPSAPLLIVSAVAFLFTGCAFLGVSTHPATVATPVAATASSIVQPLPRLEDLPPDSLLNDGDATAHPHLASPWVDSVLSRLTLRQKAAQMVVPFTFSDVDGKKLRELRDLVKELGVGGVII